MSRSSWNCLFEFYKFSSKWRLKSNRLRSTQRFWSWRNVKNSWELTDLLFFFVMFNTRKNLSIALSRIKKSFWCFLRTWCDDDENNEINWNDCSNKIDENSRVFRSKRSVWLEESRMNFREKIDSKWLMRILKKEKL